MEISPNTYIPDSILLVGAFIWVTRKCRNLVFLLCPVVVGLFASLSLPPSFPPFLLSFLLLSFCLSACLHLSLAAGAH